MAAPAIGLRPRFAPNPATARVDWSHPLAQGLMFYALGGIDLVTRAALSPQPAASTASPTRSGPAVGGGIIAGSTLPSTTFPTARCSMFAVASYGAGTGYESTVAFHGSSTGAGLLFDRSNGRLTYLNRAIAVHDLATGLSRNTVYTIGSTCAGNGGTIVGYIDGNRQSTATLGTMNPVTTGSYWLLATDNGNLAAADSRLTCGGIWNRVLSDAEMAQVHADPFCMLRS